VTDDPRLVRHPLGFYRVRDVPTPEELQAFYADQYFQEEKGLYRAAYPPEELDYFRVKTSQFAACVAELRGTDQPGSLLDVGCGEGFALQQFADHGWAVSGIDFSSAGIEAMNPAMVDRCEFGDVFDLLDQRIDAGDSYDVVWLKHVLEHVVDPLGLLETLRKLTRPGGLLVVTVPNDFSPLQQVLWDKGAISERFWIALPDHLNYFNAESLVNVAEHCGWTVRDLLSDFPIDVFLLHKGSNYQRDRDFGPAAHQARLAFENMLGAVPHERVNALYRAMAQVGVGRSLTAFLQPGEDDVHDAE